MRYVHNIVSHSMQYTTDINPDTHAVESWKNKESDPTPKSSRPKYLPIPGYSPQTILSNQTGYQIGGLKCCPNILRLEAREEISSPLLLENSTIILPFVSFICLLSIYFWTTFFTLCLCLFSIQSPILHPEHPLEQSFVNGLLLLLCVFSFDQPREITFGLTLKPLFHRLQLFESLIQQVQRDLLLAKWWRDAVVQESHPLFKGPSSLETM